MDKGTIFKVTADGVLTTLHTFNGTDGTAPHTGLILASDGNFYGTTSSGGSYNKGTIYRITPQGTFTSLVSFNGNNGENPRGPLLEGADGNLYVAVYSGGPSGSGGTVARIVLGPHLVTKPASSIRRTSVDLNVDVNSFGEATTLVFEYGTTNALGISTSPLAIGATTTLTSFQTALSGLQENTTYFYQAVATSASGTRRGEMKNFTTSPLPAVTTLETTNIGFDSAVLNGSICGNGLAATYVFDWGASPALDQTTGPQTLPDVNGLQTVNTTITGLALNTDYIFRLRGTNENGNVNGTTLTFSTPPLVKEPDGRLTLAAGKTWTMTSDFTLTNGLTVLGTLNTAGYRLSVQGKLSIQSSATVQNAQGVIAYRDREGGLPPGTIELLGDAAHDALDIEGDGLNSLMEFVLGTDPEASSVDALPTPAVLGGAPILTYRMPAGISGAQAVVEVSKDLTNWSSGPGFMSVVSDTTVGGVRTIVVRSELEGVLQYMRLRATR